MTDREHELEAQVAALQAACRVPCGLAISHGMTCPIKLPEDGAAWLADARAVTAVAALYRKEMQTLFDGLKVLPPHLADMIDPLVVSHLCTQLALWLGEPDSSDALARAEARWGLED